MLSHDSERNEMRWEDQLLPNTYTPADLGKIQIADKRQANWATNGDTRNKYFRFEKHSACEVNGDEPNVPPYAKCMCTVTVDL
jgi:hypothetical protein